MPLSTTTMICHHNIVCTSPSSISGLGPQLAFTLESKPFLQKTMSTDIPPKQEEDNAPTHFDRGEQLATNKRINKHFELHKSPSTQEWVLHCNALPGEKHLEWIMDRVFSTTASEDFNRPFAKPPMDTFINDKLRKKIAKKHLHHLIEKRCLVESLDSFDKFILDSNAMKSNLSRLHSNLRKAIETLIWPSYAT